MKVLVPRIWSLTLPVTPVPQLPCLLATEPWVIERGAMVGCQLSYQVPESKQLSTRSMVSGSRLLKESCKDLVLSFKFQAPSKSYLPPWMYPWIVLDGMAATSWGLSTSCLTNSVAAAEAAALAISAPCSWSCFEVSWLMLTWWFLTPRQTEAPMMAKIKRVAFIIQFQLYVCREQFGLNLNSMHLVSHMHAHFQMYVLNLTAFLHTNLNPNFFCISRACISRIYVRENLQSYQIHTGGGPSYPFSLFCLICLNLTQMSKCRQVQSKKYAQNKIEADKKLLCMTDIAQIIDNCHNLPRGSVKVPL